MARWFAGRGDERVPREWRAALEKALRELDESRRGIASAATSYVLTGAHASVLNDLASVGHPYRVLNMWSYGGVAGGGPGGAVFRHLAEVPPEVGMRLGQVIASVASANHQLAQPPHVRWAEALLVAVLNAENANQQSRQVSLPLDIRVVEAMSVSAGRPAWEPLVAAFANPNTPSWQGHGRYRIALRALQGYADAVGRHAEAIRPALDIAPVDDRLIVLEMLAGLPPEVLALFGAELADYATGSSSQVRAAAYAPLQACGTAAVEPLQEIARSGKPGARLEALERLHTVADPDIQEWALHAAGDDRAASVRALADRWSAPAQEATEPESLPVVEVPLIDWRTPVTSELRAGLEAVVAEVNAQVDRSNRAKRRTAEQWRQTHGGTADWLREDPLLGRDFLDTVLAALEAGKPPGKKTHRGVTHGVSHHLGEVLPRHLPRPPLGPAGLTVLLAHGGLLSAAYGGGLNHPAATAYTALHAATGRPTMLELATMLDQVGLDGSALVFDSFSSERGQGIGRGWRDEAVAPFVQLHLERVLELLQPSRERDYWRDPLASFVALRTLPSLPPSVVDRLFAVALGSRKTERRPAQDALANVPGIESRVITALSDGKGETRAQAAQWLGRLGHEPAVPALEAAVAKEKQDVALGAMLDALQALGQPVEKYLDREALADQATKAVAKGLPKDLAWFPWEDLPAVHWASGEPVPLVTLQWFLAQAVKSKSPEPNAVLRKYCELFDPSDREALGQYVLEAWIGQDLAPISEATARSQAAAAAASMQQWMRADPEYFKDNPLRNATLEQIIESVLPAHLRTPAGSAISSKGLLAVAAACAGERAAPVVQRYLKEWYGMRAAQGRALIVMLAWIEHPSATQLMLSVGSRFRTKSFQDEATRQAELLAERKGWTVGELADRTIPTAGFDEHGVLELSYGDRVFTARLLPDLSIALTSPDGARVKALPAPRQSDDEAAAAQAKKALAAAKKELKSVVTLQSERLYEALCTERTWLFEDWQRYLAGHPVMHQLVQRLAWTATQGDETVVFRPLDDGTLTDVEDEPVTVSADAVVAVAHDSNLDAERVAAWQAHFADYEVTPLFQQFGKGTFELPERSSTATEITDFLGHLIEAFTLRGKAAKLGYTRGSAQDGGWFFTYEKRFPSLGVTAVVGFSGNGLPEQNRTVALGALSFERHGKDGSTATMRLSEVPAILLSEAWNDVRLLAADGSGFAEDWEKKVEL